MEKHQKGNAGGVVELGGETFILDSDRPVFRASQRAIDGEMRDGIAITKIPTYAMNRQTGRRDEVGCELLRKTRRGPEWERVEYV